MHILQIEMTEDVRGYYNHTLHKLYRNKAKREKAWMEFVEEHGKKLTSKEYLDLPEEIRNPNPNYWHYVVGEPETIADELAKITHPDYKLDYDILINDFPEDHNEDRKSWYEINAMASEMYYFIQHLKNYI